MPREPRQRAIAIVRRPPVLAKDDTGGGLSSIVAAMTFLAALALAAAVLLSTAAGRWQANLTGTLTVELPPAAGPRGRPDVSADAQRLAAALKVLRETPGVVSANAIAREELATMLGPWLGHGALPAGLPLPQLIDVELATGIAVGVDELAARLGEAAPGARVDDHRRWTDGLLRLAAYGELATILLILIVAAVAALAVVLTTRARLAAEREAIAIVHLMGASDGFIARVFAREALKRSLQGGFTGLGAALLGGMATLFAISDLAPGLAATAAAASTQLAVLLALPLMAAALAAIVAWWTTWRTLLRLL